MNIFLRILLINLCILISGLVHADLVKADKLLSTKSIANDVKVNGKHLILNTMKSADKNFVYLIHNNSKQSVYINHPPKKVGSANAGWMSRLSAQQWSALMVSEPNFAITCQNKLMASEQSFVSCKRYLKIYRFKPQKLMADKQGNYWLGENQSLEKLKITLKTRGIETANT